jgi:hypothetical protein
VFAGVFRDDVEPHISVLDPVRSYDLIRRNNAVCKLKAFAQCRILKCDRAVLNRTQAYGYRNAERNSRRNFDGSHVEFRLLLCTCGANDDPCEQHHLQKRFHASS